METVVYLLHFSSSLFSFHEGIYCHLFIDFIYMRIKLKTVSTDSFFSGASAVEGSEKTDVEERSRTTLIICPLSVLSNWIVSLHSLLKI